MALDYLQQKKKTLFASLFDVIYLLETQNKHIFKLFWLIALFI